MADIIIDAQRKINNLLPIPPVYIEEAKEAYEGYFVAGKSNHPLCTIKAYVDDNMYLEEDTYPKAIEYKIRFGEESRYPLLLANLRFEGLYLGNHKKQAYINTYSCGKNNSLDLSLDDDVNIQVRSIIDGEVAKTNLLNHLLEGELKESYERMFAILEPLFNKSMEWLNSSESDLDTKRVRRS